MVILITGGAGFIGSNLARYVNKVAPSTEIRILDNLSTGRRSNLHGIQAKFIEGSVAHPEVVEEAAANADTIIHLGALGSVPRSVKDPVASHIANLTGTLYVLEAARKNDSHIIFSSSSSVYGANKKLPKSEFDWTRPISPYAASKLGAESYVLAYSHAYDLPATVFRFFNVYGPYQPADHVYAAVVPRFIDSALRNEPLVVHGDGNQSRDFTHVDTVCKTLWSAATRRLAQVDPVNLAFGTSTSLLELIEVLEAELGRPLPRQHVDSRVGDVRASRADGIRLKEIFPDARAVPLAEGVKSTVDWFRQK